MREGGGLLDEGNEEHHREEREHQDDGHIGCLGGASAAVEERIAAVASLARGTQPSPVALGALRL